MVQELLSSAFARAALFGLRVQATPLVLTFQPVTVETTHFSIWQVSAMPEGFLNPTKPGVCVEVPTEGKHQVEPAPYLAVRIEGVLRGARHAVAGNLENGVVVHSFALLAKGTFEMGYQFEFERMPHRSGDSLDLFFSEC
jgi:hypothetical protein